MKIEILGPGCAKCGKLYEATQAEVQKVGVPADVSNVSDLAGNVKGQEKRF